MHRLLCSSGFAARWTGLVVSTILTLVSCGGDEQVAPEELAPVAAFLLDPVALERGRALYEGSCASFCHEVEDPDLAVNLFDCEWRHGSEDTVLFDIITRGIPDTRMVGFGENFPEGEQDTWRLVAFLRSQQTQCTQGAE
ncbi:MAG: c-type cytochrome [Pseudohongiellaceae bacterium]